MAEFVATDRPSVAKPVPRPRSRKPATVSASALALHLDCSRTYIGKLVAEGVIRRQGDSFRSTGAALLTCDTCDASVSGHLARRLMPNTPRSRLRCCNCG